MNNPLMAAAGTCVLTAVVEGLAAGKDVKRHLASLQQPRFAAPLWLWFVIGGLYYVVCFVLLVRLCPLTAHSVIARTAINLTMLLMLLNILWSFTFFRLRNLGLSAVVAGFYVPIASALLVALWFVDRVAAIVFACYAIYLVYGTRWTMRIWRLNRTRL